jgi:hypothetical protein
MTSVGRAREHARSRLAVLKKSQAINHFWMTEAVQRRAVRSVPSVAEMHWTYRRGDQMLSLDTSYDRDLGEYILRWQYPGGGEDLERYTNDFTFRQRLLALEDDLRVWGWKPVASRSCLRDGWQNL